MKYTAKALNAEIEKNQRYAAASPLERQILEIEERYRLEFEKSVNNLDRRDGSPAGQERIRIAFDRLRAKYKRHREEEVARIKGQCC